MKPLRILLMADVHPNPDSGAAGTEVRLAEALERQGHEIRRVWADSLSRRIRHGNLHQLLEQPLAYRAAIRAELQAGRAYDVWHVNQPAGWWAARAHRRRQEPGIFVHRSHGYEPRIAASLAPWRERFAKDDRAAWRRLASGLIEVGLRRAYRAIERHADAHVVSCSECARFLESRGVPAERIHINVQAPPDTFLSSPLAPWSRERGRRVLYVGQYALLKGPVFLGEVLREVLGQDSGLSATWVCAREHHPEVRRMIPPSLQGRLSLLDWMPQEQLIGVYDQHGLFLFPSFAEGFGKVVLEAMARGLCVVSTNQGGARDLITSGSDGVLVPVGDVTAMIAAVRGLCLEPQRASGLGRAARATATSFTWERSASSLAEFYRRCLDVAMGPAG